MSTFTVAVIGAGVSGLTAAHELAERGFQVDVFDGEHDALNRGTRDYTVGDPAQPAYRATRLSAQQPVVGGLAATQWYRIPQAWGEPAELTPFHRLELASSVNLARPEDWLPRDFEPRYLGVLGTEAAGALVPFLPQQSRLIPYALWRIGRLAAQLAALFDRGPIADVELCAGPYDGEPASIGPARAQEILLELTLACRRRGLVVTPSHLPGGEFHVADAARTRSFHVRIVAEAAPPRAVEAKALRLVEVRMVDGTPVAHALPEPFVVPEVTSLSLWEQRWPLLPFAPNESAVSEFVGRRITEIAARLKRILVRVHAHEHLVIGGVIAANEDPEAKADPFTDPARLAFHRAEAVAQALSAACSALGLSWTALEANPPTFRIAHPQRANHMNVRVIGLGAIHATEAARDPADQRYVEVRLLDRLLPGEHGYRFFPSFYHHVFDTMKRIPLLVPGKRDPFMLGLGLGDARANRQKGPPRESWEASARTVFDNLRSVDLHALDSGAEGSVRPMQRFNTRSLRGLLGMLDTFQEHSDVPLRDIVLGQLKVLRYATSCAGRRDGYESQTWSQFTEAHLGGPEYRRLLDHWPQALVGLQASRADARTTGTVLLQLLLDQLRDSGYRDGTLNAPTSEAWLDPWKRYLEHQRKVRFVCAKIEKLRFARPQGPDVRIRVSVSGTACDGETVIDPTAIPMLYDYVVVATPADVTAKLGASLRAYIELDRIDPELKRPGLLAEFERSPFHGVRRLLPEGERYQVEAGSEDPFEHFSGVQFFLTTDFAPLRGHVYYPNSPWRLSSVSQSQFRLDRPGRLEGYTGVISVVIGAFDVPGHNDKTAWACTARQIAEEVWDQITKSLQRSPEGAPAPPQYYAIDKNLIFGGEDRPAVDGETPPSDVQGQPLIRNLTPFLVNSADKVTAFPERPGAYEVHMGHFVFAGTYLKTRTRLVTMEAANESARHAVNAVVRHGRDRLRALGSASATGQACPIYDPEEREPEELLLLHRIDAELLARGLPHWMDILEVEPQAQALLERGDGARGPGVAGALLDVLGSASGIGSELLRVVRGLLLGRS